MAQTTLDDNGIAGQIAIDEQPGWTSNGDQAPMTSHRSVVGELVQSAERGDSVVLATVVRVTGSSYGGVGARMLVRVDGSTVGLLSGGFVESDIAGHARRVHETGRAEVVSYDTRDDEDAPWGLGLGCNGLIEVLLEPLSAAEAMSASTLIGGALAANRPSALASVIVSPDDPGSPSVGAHASIGNATMQTTGNWGDGAVLAALPSALDETLATGRRGLVREYDGVQIAFDVVTPTLRLVICGSGPDALPIARFAAQLGWEVIVVDHQPVDSARDSRFPDARVVECSDPAGLADVVHIDASTAAVVVSHHFARDLDYVHALLTADAAYIGVLGPRARTQRMLADLAARGVPPVDPGGSLYGPVGLDIGGDGPEAIALAIVAEAAAVVNGRSGGHLRSRRGSMHSAGSTT